MIPRDMSAKITEAIHFGIEFASTHYFRIDQKITWSAWTKIPS